MVDKATEHMRVEFEKLVAMLNPSQKEVLGHEAVKRLAYAFFCNGYAAAVDRLNNVMIDAFR